MIQKSVTGDTRLFFPACQRGVGLHSPSVKRRNRLRHKTSSLDFEPIEGCCRRDAPNSAGIDVAKGEDNSVSELKDEAPPHAQHMTPPINLPTINGSGDEENE